MSEGRSLKEECGLTQSPEAAAPVGSHSVEGGGSPRDQETAPQPGTEGQKRNRVFLGGQEDASTPAQPQNLLEAQPCAEKQPWPQPQKVVEVTRAALFLPSDRHSSLRTAGGVTQKMCGRMSVGLRVTRGTSLLMGNRGCHIPRLQNNRVPRVQVARVGRIAGRTSADPNHEGQDSVGTLCQSQVFNRERPTQACVLERSLWP